MPHSGRLLATGLAAMAGLLALPAGAASADSTTALTQLTAFHQILVDQSAGYVFLSEGQDSGAFLSNGADDTPGVVVTDLAGNYVTTLDAGMGVEGLALSPDGSILYAALGPDNAVAAIDVSSITSTTTVPTQTYMDLGGWETPYSLAIQSGKLWVSYNPQQDSSPGQSGIGYFDLSQAAPSFTTPAGDNGAPAMGTWFSAPDLAADPSDSGILVASQMQQSLAAVATYDVAGSTVTTLAPQQSLQDDGNDNCDNLSSLAVAPGGDEFVVACGHPYSQYYYSPTDLSDPLGDYPTTTYPNAVAIASGTGLVAASTFEPYPDPAVYVYEPGGSTPVNAYDFGYSPTGPNEEVADAGLALSPDGSELYAVTSDGTTYTLHVFDQPAQPKTSIALTGPTTASTGPLTLSGSLALANDTAPAGMPISVTRTSAAGTVTLPSVTTNANGDFAVSDAPTTPGTYTYTADYIGMSKEVIATGSLTVTVAPSTTTLSLAASAGKKGVTLTGTLSFDGSHAPSGETITVVRNTPDGTVASKTLPSVTTTSNGTFTLTDAPTTSETYVYTATFAGDATHGSATANTAPVTVTVRR